MPEFKILSNIIDFMEANGNTAKEVIFSVDKQLADEINRKYGSNYSISDLEKAVDKCIANEWIEYRALGQKYCHLGITTRGIGVARSRARAEEIKASRTWLKKVSDYIEDHKGLFLVLFRATCVNCATCWSGPACCAMASCWGRSTCNPMSPWPKHLRARTGR